MKTIGIENRIKAFIKLGKFIDYFLNNQIHLFSEQEKYFVEKLQACVDNEYIYNGWFTSENILFSLRAISKMLAEKKMFQWLQPYFSNLKDKNSSKKIGVIMPGNIPLVGFHDFLCVTISGHIFLGKLSSDDKHLLPLLAEILSFYEPLLKEKIIFTEEKIPGSDAYIATGSDNTARYFEYYFKKYPNIIRRNRNSIAVLDGTETLDDLSLLADDVMLYFGLGCRSISKLFVPKDYDFSHFFQAIEKYQHYKNHKKYANNYDYYKAIYLINKQPFLDNGFLMLIEDRKLSSPIACLNYEIYNNIDDVKKQITEEKNKIQCLVAKTAITPSILPFGKAQQPELWDYADGIDTIQFLLQV